jgi:hypothetical protein
MLPANSKQMTDWTEIGLHILAGKALFTFVSKKTEKHFTYKVEKLDDTFKQMEDGHELWIVKKLTGPDNDSNYRIIGTIWRHPDGKWGYKDKYNEKVFDYFLTIVYGNNKHLRNRIEFYHAGFCCKCGRTLTTPESIEAGVGPVCRGKI